MADLRATIDELWERRDAIGLDDDAATAAVHQAVDLLDRGEARVAELDAAGNVVVHEWLKRAILLLFRVSALQTTEVGPFEYVDKLPLKGDFAAAGVRVVPGASARWGSFIERGVVLMPSYVNIGARVGAGSMVDTWATVGSCAQIGANVHLSGGVGIGGVLEPAQAAPVIVEDEVLIGSRCMVTQGARVGRGAVLAEGCILNPGVPVIDAETGEELSRGVVPGVVGGRAGHPAAGVPGRDVRPSVPSRHPPADRRRASRQGPAERHAARARRRGLNGRGERSGRIRRSSAVPVTDLVSATAELVAIASESHHESALADEVERRLHRARHLVVDRIGDNVVARSQLGRPRRLVLAGHLDTVPANGNATPEVTGDTVAGLGAADMKGGLAAMLDVAAAVREPTVDVTFVFYVGEEVARVHNGLLAIAAARPELLAGDAAVLGEPTSARIEAGCQGTLKAVVTVGGARAHTARPWMGVNAVHRLAPVLDLIARYQPRRPVLDGCEYREALQVVGVDGGVAGNVVPDRATLTVNHRFAPDRDAAAAEAALRSLVGQVLDPAQGDDVAVVEAAPGAPPALDDPLLAALVEASGQPPRAKLGWTDVAFFAERGIPAVNFGPGDPELAHTAGEWVGRDELERVAAILRRLLAG